MVQTDPLPDLDAGVTLLRGGDRGALAALVLAELNRAADRREAADTASSAERSSAHRSSGQSPREDGGPASRADGVARWVDARNHAATYPLDEQARTRRTLERVQVARAFTAHQHHSLVRQLVQDARRPTALVVATAVDDLYGDDDLLAGEAERLREASLSTLRALADARDVPVLVTASDPDAVAEYADDEIVVESTRFGPKFSGDCEATTAYWTRGGWQTTIPHWVDLLGPVGEDEPAWMPREVVA